jgi:hypothetical protein
LAVGYWLLAVELKPKAKGQKHKERNINNLKNNII